MPWTTMRLYAADLPVPGLPGAPHDSAVFACNDDRTLEQLSREDIRYEQTGENARGLSQQLSEGEVCVSGRIGGELAYYGWIQFRYRQISKSRRLPIGPGQAFVYRCRTLAHFRGKGIYTAALRYKLGWLADAGVRRVLIDVSTINHPSIKAIERVGMRRVGSYKVLHILRREFAVVRPSLTAWLSKAPGNSCSPAPL